MAFKFQRTRNVTLPTFKLKKNVSYFFKLQSPMQLGKEIPNSKMGRATVMQGLDLETGELGILLCRAILQRELADHYPNDSYVGKCFEISLYRIPEKKYDGVTIAEVADPTDDPEWQATVSIEAARRQSEGAAGICDMSDVNDLGSGNEEFGDETPGEVYSEAEDLVTEPPEMSKRPTSKKSRR